MNMKKFFILFFILLSTFLTGCQNPICFPRPESVVFTLPHWPAEDNRYPDLDYWEVIITKETGKEKFHFSKSTEEITLTFEKDKPASILCYPVTKEKSSSNFFFPAGTVYPYNLQITWEGGIAADIMKMVFEQVPSVQRKNALTFFNWKKLYDALQKKDFESFSKYDSLKTKKCTTAFNTDSLTLLQRILEPPSRFTVPYFDTSSLLPEKIKGITFSKDNLPLCSYIPLNDLNKEKGCITVQTEPENYKTAYLYENKIIYIQNKKLYLEQ